MPVDLRSQPSGPAPCLVKQTQDNTSIRYGRRGGMCFHYPFSPMMEHARGCACSRPPDRPTW